MAECEEPGCTRGATNDWKGRTICNDHYDFYKDREERRIMEMDF